MHIENLPPEILWTILDLITHVPSTFDTSFSTIQSKFDKSDTSSGGADMVHNVLRSTKIKAQLSLVSKKFHSFMELSLYKHIVITHFETVPVLLDRLRTIPQGFHTPRGHTCIRLDIYLGTGPTQHEYRDEAWYEGGHTLWGLIPICPNLQILIAHILNSGAYESNFPHLTPTCLWKALASSCARTLRMLEISGLSIRMDRVEMMLRYLKELEVVRIYDCEPFCDINFRRACQDDSGDDHAAKEVNGWKPDVYDDEEPSSRSWEFFVFIGCGTYLRRMRRRMPELRAGPNRIKGVQRSEQQGRRHSDWFSEEDVAAWRHARLEAAWPPFDESSGPPYVLPRLHTLTLDTFNHRFFQFLLPSLRFLGAPHVQNTFPFKIYETDTYLPLGPQRKRHQRQGTRSRSPLLPRTDSTDDHGWFKKPTIHSNQLDPKLSYQYFPTPSSLERATLFGAYPKTITHLNIKHIAPLHQILYFFPNLTHLILNHFCGYDEKMNEFQFDKPNTVLRSIRLNRWGYNTKAISDILEAVRCGWIANLEEIVVERKNVDTSVDYQTLGVELKYR